ncbi:GIY-YIG nuclease family protein [Enterococcus sp.]|uniref:GIY-YIG nuclease family protein n=1 Tax=Enterococcus sp. TaxID=35783 RepID=UPI002FC9AFFD
MKKLPDGTAIFFLREGDNVLTDNRGFIVSKSDFNEMLSLVKETYENTTDEKINNRNDELMERFLANIQQASNGVNSNRRKKNENKEGYVYFVKSDDSNKFIKIGCTSNLDSRFKLLQTSSPYRLTIMGYIKITNFTELESDIHRYFQNFKKSGEWFAIDFDRMQEAAEHFGKELLFTTTDNKQQEE